MSLQPTFIGHVDSTQDALVLFQAVIDGKLPTVSRRPQDRERSELVKSGSIFIFNEGTSGIKRWTDGIAWSPSRILGNFLVYRQLEKPFNPGEKKQTNKKKRRKMSANTATTPYDRPSPVMASGNMPEAHSTMSSNILPGSVIGSSLPIQIDLPSNTNPANLNVNIGNERSLVGSLVDSYGFKKDGLIKKTISIVLNGEHHHLVSYDRPEDVLAGHFEQPSKCARLKDIVVCQELLTRQHFRVSIEPAQSTGSGGMPGGMGMPFNSNSVGHSNGTNSSNAVAAGNNPATSNGYNPYMAHVSNYPDIPYDIDGFHQAPMMKQENIYYQNQPLPQSPIDTNNNNYYYNNYYPLRNANEVMPAYTTTATSVTPTTAVHQHQHHASQQHQQQQQQQQQANANTNYSSGNSKPCYCYLCCSRRCPSCLFVPVIHVQYNGRRRRL